MMTELWQRLLGVDALFESKHSLPTSAIVTMLVVATLFCIRILNARIRAREVVKG
jgi:hypothetical protein